MEKIFYESMAGENINHAIKKMLELSIEKNAEVETTFNDVTFSVTPETTPEQAYRLWDEKMKEARRRYAESPEGKAAAAEAKRRAEQKKRTDAEVDALIKDEVLKLRAPGMWKKVVARNQSEYGKAIIRYAKRWGKLMQVEMKKQQLSELPKELIEETSLRADNEYITGMQFYAALGLLQLVWRYGCQLYGYR